MALINCPECDKQISDKANNCPNCGNPINEKNTDSLSSQKVEVKSKEGCFLQTMNAGCFVVFLVVFIIILIIMLGGG